MAEGKSDLIIYSYLLKIKNGTRVKTLKELKENAINI